MLILQNILSQEIVQRLGWTLLHFIWQAAAVALILAILLRLLRKSTANLRYIIACLALALIVLLPIITIKLVPVSKPLTAAHFTPAPASTVLPIEEMPAPDTIVIAKPSQPEIVTLVPAVPFKQRAVNALEPALPYIVSGWLIGVFGLSIWHLGGWTQLQRLKRRMVKQVDSTLLNKLKMLTQKLKIKQTVRLMESALIQIPTVVGWLRPVILLPASALTGLTSEQLEAIIAHELAHIKRFDYLINILQTVIEILGFYHPVVWWVSHKIRAERENCCDDIAVSISGDRVSYAGALASMEEIRATGGKLAVAASGGNLFRRICRLLGKDSTDNTALSWVPAATAILLIIALAIPTTLALTNKSDSMLTETKTDVQVEDDISIAPALDIESLAEDIPPVPVLATSPAPPDKDKAYIKANCLVVEVPLDSNIDTETLTEAQKILGGKINLRNTKVNVILRQVAKATAAVKDESDRNKRVTEKQVNALVKMLDSKGYMKILMNPTIETLNGKKATVKSTQHVPLQQVIKSMPDSGQIIRRLNKNKLEVIDLRSNKNEYVDVVDLIEITPHVFEDGHIILDVKADLGSPKLPAFENTPLSSRKLSIQVRANPGETLIIGGLVENPPAPEEYLNISEKPANELLFILTPTIMPPPNNSPPPAHFLIEIEKVKLADKLRRLGVAVAMYADDHDDNLPESIQELKPYLLDERNFDWFRDNIEYFDKGKTAQHNAAYIPIAYDKTLLEKADGTNVLFLDFSVRFRKRSDFEQLDLKRAKFIVEARFLLVGEDFLKNINLEVDTWDIAQSNLTPEALKSLGISKAGSLILNDLDVNLLLSAVKNQKDSKMLAHPQVLTREGTTAEISVINKETYYIVDYTEPNHPSEKPQPKLDRVEEGITMSLRPKLTSNNNIGMEFKLDISQISGFKEKMYKEKYPCKLPTIQRTTQSTCYTAKDGQTLLFGGHKIADKWGGQSEQKDLLVLIKAHTIDSSEQDKPAKTENLVVTEPPSSTTKVITPPAIAKSTTETPSDNEQEKTKSTTESTRPDESVEPNEPMVTVNLKNADMKTIIEKLSEWTGKVIIPTDESLKQKITLYSPRKVPRNKALEGIYSVLRRNGYIAEQADGTIFLKPIMEVKTGEVPKISEDYPLSMVENTDQVVQKSFKLKHYSPSQMGHIIHPLLGEYGHVSADESTGTLIVIDTVKSLMRIEAIIEQFDVSKPDQVVVTEIFEIRNGDPEEIVKSLRTLISTQPGNDAIIEQGKEPIVLIPQPTYKWIIAKASADDINQIGQWIKKLDIKKSLIGLDPIDKAVHQQLEMIVDLSELNPGMSFAEVIEILENSVEPPLQIQPIWKDLLDNAEVEQTTPAGMDPLLHIKLRKALEILLTSVSSTGLPKLTYVVDEGIILIGTEGVLPPKMSHRVYDISDPNELRKTTELLSHTREKIAKLPDKSEKQMTPLEQVQKQLDELIKRRQAPQVTEPNLPMDPNVPLISNTFIDCPLIDALQSIAEAADVTIIPDENVKGLITCTLKDVTFETALDIILAGTPYTWKKTQHYYLVASRLELSKMVHRVYDISDLVTELANYRMSGSRSMKMGGMGGMMEDQGGYMQAQNLVQLIQETIEPDSWHDINDTGEGTIMAYPMQSPRKLAVMQTNKVHQEIEKLLNAKRESLGNQVSISIEGVFLSVSDDFLKYVGLDTNPEKFSDAWNEHLAATYPASPNGQTYGLILDDLQVRFLLKAVQADKDSKALVAPLVRTRAGTTTEIGPTEEYRYIKSYNEPNSPSDEPQPKRDKVKLGPHMWLTPKLTDDNKNFKLDIKLEMRQLEDIIEGKYKGKYPYYKPVIDVISAKMPCTIPDGKTMLIGGLKIIEPIKKEPSALQLKDLPLIGAAFSSKDKIKEQKMLLILIKPIINPRQKATKIRPGEEDSEEHIKRLAEQLDKKINTPASPNN